MTDDELHRAILVEARNLTLASKQWGEAPETAIKTGQWDKGSVVRSWLPEAERIVLARREEAVDE
jgi:hypothetical protein